MKNVFIFFVLMLAIVNSFLAREEFLPLPIINRSDKRINFTSENVKVKNDVTLLTTKFIGPIKWERSQENKKAG